MELEGRYKGRNFKNNNQGLRKLSMRRFPVKQRILPMISEAGAYGFTLVELLIGMVLGLIVLEALISVFYNADPKL